MDDLLQEFITETIENLAGLDQQLLDLESSPDDAELVRSIFRTLHTIKGTCGFLGLSRMEKVAHASETLLGKMRDGELGFSSDIGSMLFEAIDRLKEIVEAVETNQNYTDSAPDEELIQHLLRLAEGVAPQKTSSEDAVQADAEAQASVDEPVVVEVSDSIDASQAVAEEKVAEDEFPADFFDGPVSVHRLEAEQAPVSDSEEKKTTKSSKKKTKSKEEPVSEDLAFESIESDSAEQSSVELEKAEPINVEAEHVEAKVLEEVPTEIMVESVDTPASSSVDVSAVSAAPQAAAAATAADTNFSIRVGVEVLDNLINLVSELVLTRNQLVQLFQREKANQIFDTALSRLSYITSELQDEVMKTRMQPIDNAWTKFPRMIRDLSKDLGKKIKLVQEGGNTEVDRQVLELIKDPLTHMIRNSADHGIEMPEERRHSSKNEEGIVRIKAYHEGGHIIMELSDDGRGLDPQKLKAKALDKKLYTAQEVMTMSDRQLQAIIFLPGFSTAAAVTSVSGRGVGMDVVRSNIEKLGGAIDLTSTPGRGTKFIIKIPLTLTIISAVILESAGERVAIPQISITELHRVGKRSNYKIEFIKDTPVLRLRNELLPLVDLAVEMGMPGTIDRQNELDRYVVVTKIGTNQFGIIVDRIYDTQEIVVKPLSKLVGRIKLFSGSTILGDGSIVLIVDPNMIATKINSDVNNELSSLNDVASRANNRELDKTILLIFEGNKKRYAMPLCLVSRITEYDPEAVERVGNTNIIHYQNTILPIVFLDGSPPAIRQDEYDTSIKPPMLMFYDRGRSVAIGIDEIISIDEARLDIEFSTKSTGILGSTIIDGQTTLILDSEYYIKSIFPEWFEDHSPDKSKGQNKPRVLFVEDSNFFKNLMIPLLSLSGYEITLAGNGLEALEVLSDNQDFNAVVTDIEMPQMDGYELVREIRSRPNMAHLPVVALSSKAADEDIQRGIEAGFTAHLSKSDQKLILKVLEQYKIKNVNQSTLPDSGEQNDFF